MIRDPNPAYSAVAVEPGTNMVVITDESLFQILEYDRLDNTPPSALMTEPKRVIGGNQTKAEMMCGVYIDPTTQDTYIVNNDTQDWLSIFGKDQRGNAAPKRLLATPHGTFGIAMNESAQEMYLAVQHENSVVVYRKMTEGKEKPLCEISGNDTQLEDPHGVALDTKTGLVSVSNHGSVSYRGTGGGQTLTGGREFERGSGKFERLPLRSIRSTRRATPGRCGPSKAPRPR